MYISDLLESYPYTVDFFEAFGLELNSKHTKLGLYLENLGENFFHEIGIEKTQLVEHFLYFIMSTEKFKSKNKAIIH
jgi:hypothetical protein